jgi:transposase
MSKIYVGVDLHKESFVYVMLTSEGERLVSGQCALAAGPLAEFLSGLSARHEVVVEPLTNSFWFIEQVRQTGAGVHLANSRGVRLIAESRCKTDRIDARILADLLRIGYLPEVYQPSACCLSWRQLVADHGAVVSDQVRCCCRIRALVAREGVRVRASTCVSKRGRAELAAAILSVQTRQQLTRLLTRHDVLAQEKAEVDRQIEQVVATDRIASLLQTVDGIGALTALALRAHIGDIRRFGSPKALAAYTGLTPSLRQSAETVHYGHITRQGPSVLRWLLIQAVPHAVRKTPYLRRLYGRLCHRRSVGVAKVAVAHALVRMVWHVWREARPYYRVAS